MKLLSKIVLLLLPTFFMAQESIKFEESSFQEILDKAKQQNKLVFLDAYAAWCGPCKLMEKNVFTTKSVSEYFNSTFINAHFDMEKGEGPKIAQKYGIRSYPTFLILNGNGEVILKRLGYMNEFEFLSFAKEVGNSKDKGLTLKERFEKGESSPEFLIATMKQYVDGDYEFAKKVSEKYFQLRKPSEYTKDDIGLLFYFVRSPNDANFSVLQKNKAEIIKHLPETSYTEFENSIKVADVFQKSLDEKNSKIKDTYFLENATPLIGKEEAEKFLNRMKVNFYSSIGNFGEYEKAALQYYQNSDAFDSNEILKAAWIFSEHITTPSSLKKAQEWAEKSVMRGETSENTYILATLYKKTGNKDAAKMFAEVAKRLVEQQGGDPTMATTLLNELK